MSIQVICSNCQASYQVDEAHAGKRGKCKKCGNPISVPNLDNNDIRVSNFTLHKHTISVIINIANVTIQGIVRFRQYILTMLAIFIVCPLLYWSYTEYEFYAYKKARDTQELSDWSRASNENSVQSIKSYLNKYPYGKYKRDAEDSLPIAAWDESLKLQSIEVFETYIRDYPNGVHVQDAKNMLEQLNMLAQAEKKNSIEIYMEFKRKYPQSQFISKAEKSILNLEQMEKQRIEAKIDQLESVVVEARRKIFPAWKQGLELSNANADLKIKIWNEISLTFKSAAMKIESEMNADLSKYSDTLLFLKQYCEDLSNSTDFVAQEYIYASTGSMDKEQNAKSMQEKYNISSIDALNAYKIKKQNAGLDVHSTIQNIDLIMETEAIEIRRVSNNLALKQQEKVAAEQAMLRYYSQLQEKMQSDAANAPLRTAPKEQWHKTKSKSNYIRRGPNDMTPGESYMDLMHQLGRY